MALLGLAPLLEGCSVLLSAAQGSQGSQPLSLEIEWRVGGQRGWMQGRRQDAGGRGVPDLT